MKLLLLSGGLDSATLLASRQDIELCLFVDYGQKQVDKEADAVSKLACELSKRLVEVASITIPGDPAPHTFNLPGRNTILATLGAAAAKENGLDGVLMGINADDHEHYTDCRREWVEAMNEVLRLSDLPPLLAPYLYFTKDHILKIAKASGLDVSLTTSCYEGNECGRCGACEVRAKCLK